MSGLPRSQDDGTLVWMGLAYGQPRQEEPSTKYLGVEVFGTTAACRNNFSYNNLSAYQEGSSADAEQSAEMISFQLTRSTGKQRKPRRQFYLIL